MKNFKDWREEQKHLPVFMRDFHDQKDLFKAMHEIVKVEEHEYTKGVSWVTGHCYIIDIFLWFMARYGYTLQKTRTKIEFRDIRKDIEYCRNERMKRFKL